MKHILEQQVYYGDTDAYGVAWHGAYIRWMEAGRVEFCRELGLDLVKLKENNVVIPVTNLNIRYKSSAVLDEKIIVETFISKFSPFTITFSQIIKNKETEQVHILAEVEVVAVNTAENRMYRRMPEILKTLCERAVEPCHA